MATTFSSVGHSFVHGEGPEKVTGRTVYGVDVTRPSMLWGKTLRSPLPHARIVSIDTSRAKRIPGVHAVLTGDDVPTTRVGRFLQGHARPSPRACPLHRRKGGSRCRREP